MSADFKFKEFNVVQKRAAMKVGTDGVLLGAWIRLEPWQQAVLDVGTGTGLVALMTAQRTADWGTKVVGIDIDRESAAEARYNCDSSPWSERLAVECCALQNYTTTHSFDHIVSNPPYFVNSLISPDSARTAARHTTELTFEALAAHSARLLSENGLLSVVLPYEAAGDMIVAAARNGLFLCRRCDVGSKPQTPPIRVLLEFGRTTQPTLRESLTIHDRNGLLGYSADYIELTKDFYLKF